VVNTLALQSITKKYLAGAPSSPEDVKLIHDAEGWYLTWKKPADSGGLSLTSYAIDFRFVF
jgi:hypothetical protein